MLPIQLPEYTGIVIGTVIYGAIAATLLYAFSVALKEAWLARSARNWPKTQGHVLSSAVRYFYKVGHVPKINYDYFVDGRYYRSRRVQFARIAYDRATADAIVKRYRPGRLITVHYHPHYKGEAYLKPGKHNAVLSLLLNAIACLIGASLLAALILATVYDQLVSGR